MLDTIRQDVTYALRLLGRSPVFAITAALSLAIGIGANAAIFSLASALLLRPLPGLHEAGRLVDLGRRDRGGNVDTVSFPVYRDVRERATTVSGVYGYRVEPSPVSLGGRGEAERIYGSTVTGNFFEVLGTRPALGRFFTDADDTLGGPHTVAVLGHDLWSRRFNADPSIVGQSILLNSHPFTVLGVAPAGFQGTTLLKPDLWVPLSATVEAAPQLSADLFDSRRASWLFMGGRLAPGATVAQADAELRAIAGALAHEYPAANGELMLAAIPSAVVPGQTRLLAGFLGILMALVGIVLVTACVNISGMLLARSAARRREMAVRLAVGAGRARLVRQLLTESLVLFAVAGLAGLIISRWLTSLLLAVLPQLPVPIALDVPSDWRVVAFAVGATLLAALVTGLLPALQSARADLAPALKAESLAGTAPRLRLRNAFVVSQVALSVVLVVAAALFFRALQHAAAIAPGFNEQRVDVARLDLALAGYKDGTGDAFVRELLDRLRARPDVVSASAGVDLPLDGGRFGLGPLRVPGSTRPADAPPLGPDWNVVEPGFFRTLELAIVRGRDFTDADTASSRKVAVVNQALAREAWPDLADPGDAVGRTLEMEGMGGPDTLTVVGVMADARMVSLDRPAEPYIAVPLSQHYMSGVSLVVRHATDASIVPGVRTLVREMNPNLPVSEALSLADVTAIGLVPQRLAAAVSGSLGIVALLLAAIGVYGVTAYSVSRRGREIGIRVALGADARHVLRLVLRQGLVLAAIGVVVGSVLAATGAKLLESLLYGISAFDAPAFGGALVLFALASFVATWLPARRALAVDPVVALRNE